tara:strand:+ start:301 stop:600 length:300 start_codon:yes stop_codon:yes gene_type:complete
MIEKSLVYINLILLFIFANIYYLLSLSGGNLKESDDKQSYIYYYGVAAQGAFSGPQNLKSDFAIIVGIIQLYMTIYINVIELAGQSDGYLLKTFKKLVN